MMKLYLSISRYLTVVLLLVSMLAFGQSRTVTGTVTSSDDGTGIPGANILVKGTNSGTVSDSNGNFSISVSSNDVLVISFVGYMTQEIAVGDQTVLNVTLELDITSLSEVVVVGYGQVEKKDLTGSVLSFSDKDFNKGVVSSPQQLLVGKVAGVQITSNSGSPNAGTTIRIRGGSSLNATNDPLVVIDGFPVDNNEIGGFSNPLSTINPSDIENITVLKDASATAIYGSRASNGVIIITTKKGSEGQAGKMKLTYTGNYSVSTVQKYLDVLDGDQFRDLVNQLNADGFSGISQATVDLLGNENTDWQKEVYRTSFSHDHNINATGNFQNLPYRVSYGFTDQQGILKGTDNQRHSLNLNVNPSFLEGQLNITAGIKAVITNSNYGNEGAVGAASSFDPTQPIRETNAFGNYYYWRDADGTSPNGIGPANPIALIEQSDNKSVAKRVIGTLKADYAIPFVEGLRANLSAGFDIASSEGHNNVDVNAAWRFGGRRVDYTAENSSRLLDLYLDYKKTLGSHKITLTGGYSYQHFERDGTNLDRRGNNTKFTDYQVNADGDTVPRVYDHNPNTLLSFFGRANYNFKDKYLLTATIRDDGSSRFSEDNRWGLFPSLAAAWTISNESFLIDSRILSNLKLRAGWGITGQQDIGRTYPYLPLYKESTVTASYQFGNTYYLTYRPEAYDPAIKWEETTTYNAGVDIGFLDDRITGSFDYYQRKTKDLINEIPVAAGSNLSNFLVTNVGSLENEGYEITLNAAVVESTDLNVTLGFNLTHNRNKITKLTRVPDPNYPGIYTGGIAGGVGNTVQIHRIGSPAYSYYVFEQIYDTDGAPIEGLYVDRTGNGGSVTSDDNNRYVFNNPFPDYLMGFNGRMNYKNFDFSFSGRLSLGNYNYNNVQSDRSRYNNIYYPQGSGWLNNIPTSVFDINFGTAQYLSDHFVQDASFFKMDYMSAGYNFNTFFTNKLSARVGITVNNVFTITDYDGIDPEVNFGIDNNIYPRARVFMLNFSITY